MKNIQFNNKTNTIIIYNIDKSDELYILTPYNKEFVNRIKTIPGKCWNPTTKIWSIRASHKLSLLKLVDACYKTTFYEQYSKTDEYKNEYIVKNDSELSEIEIECKKRGLICSERCSYNGLYTIEHKSELFIAYINREIRWRKSGSKTWFTSPTIEYFLDGIVLNSFLIFKTKNECNCGRCNKHLKEKTYVFYNKDDKIVFCCPTSEELILYSKYHESTFAKYLKSIDKSKYVYVIGSEKSNIIKIGYTSDIDKRLSQLNTGNSNNLQCLLKVKTRKYKELEAKLHDYFKLLNVKGEWFDDSEFNIRNKFKIYCANFINRSLEDEEKEIFPMYFPEAR